MGKEKKGNVLFNDALNTFYLRLYGVRYMVKDHSDSERGNPLPPHGLLFPISSKGSFICIIPDRITHTTAFVTSVVEHWLEREIAQWVHPMKDRSDDTSDQNNIGTLLTHHIRIVEITWTCHRAEVALVDTVEPDDADDTVPRVLNVGEVAPNVTALGYSGVVRLNTRNQMNEMLNGLFKTSINLELNTTLS